jgi:hypothetical protein
MGKKNVSANMPAPAIAICCASPPKQQRTLLILVLDHDVEKWR